MEKIWIRNALLVDDRTVLAGECLLAEGKIAAVGTNLPAPEGPVLEIDARGHYVFPGGIDPHVHLALPTPAGPSSDDFLSGSTAALLGGTTSLIDFVTPAREENLVEAFLKRRSEAAGCLTDYTFHVGLSDFHHGCADEMQQCVREYGLTSFKAYLAYRKTIGVDYDELEEIMRCAHGLNALVCVHCEDGPAIEQAQSAFLAQGFTGPEYHARSRPAYTESSAVEEVIRRCETTGCATYLVHMSTRNSVSAIRNARRNALTIAAETCPQYLLLDEALYTSALPGSLAYIMSPPLRTADDRDVLWQALSDGTLDVVSTDHCPFNIHGQKDRGLHDFTLVPNGTAGVQTRLNLLYTFGVLTGRISMNRFVELISTGPARTFGLYPRKGSLQTGADADLVIWNPDASQRITAGSLAQRCDHTPFEGLVVSGRAEVVIRGGHLLVSDALLTPDPIPGIFIRR